MDYRITVGGRPDANRCRSFKFNYGSVKNITLLLEENKLSVECRLNVKKNADQIFTDRNNYFSEAIKKGMLLHILLYSMPLSTKDVRVCIDDKELDGWRAESSPVIYSLIQENLCPCLPEEWGSADAVFQYFCKNHKSKQGDIAASLYALLYAKTKQSYTERFMYLWMSVNGLYNHLAKKKNPDLKRENKKILVLEQVEGWGSETVSQDNQGDFVSTVENVFKKLGFGTDEFYRFLSEKLAEFPSKEDPYDLSLDGYLNLWYPYFLRCKLFHADKPLALFALENEFEIMCMRFINERLESYLDHNLLYYFDESYCNKRLGITIESG